MSCKKMFAAFAAGCLLASSVVSAAEAAVDDCIKAAFAKAKSERVAVIAIGDSNQKFGGHGWTHGMTQALGKEFGCYGTGLRLFKYKAKEDAPLPQDLSAQSLGGWYVPAGKKVGPFWRNGQMIIPLDHPVGVSGNLKYYLWYGTLPDGSEIRPAARRDRPPWTILKMTKEKISTKGEQPEIKNVTLELPADAARDIPVMFSVVPKHAKIEGGFFGSATMAENLDKKSGIAYHTLYAAGGQSLYDMLHTIRDTWGQKRVASFMAQAGQTLNESKSCVVIITSALNDRNEKSKSIGPKKGFEGSSAEAYEDNLTGLAESIEKAWQASGGDVNNLTIAFMPSHAIAAEKGSKDGKDNLEKYRQMARKVAATSPRWGCIMLSEIISQPKMAENGYYDRSAKSSAHLSKKGYEEISVLVANKIAGK